MDNPCDAFLVQYVQLVKRTHWTLDYIESLDPAVWREFLEAMLGYETGLAAIRKGARGGDGAPE